MYRKFKADSIYTGHEMLGEESVLITDAKGIIKDIVDVKDAGDDIHTSEGILTPGFINCHCHIELSHLKGIIPLHTGLVDFVLAVMSQRSAPQEVKLQAMKDAAEELYQGGTSAIGDICNNDDSIPIKINSPLYWHNFIEVSGFVDATAAERIAAAEIIAEKFSQLSFPFTIVPHASYSVSETLFQKLNERSSGKLISIHNQEIEAENELYRKRSGDLLRLYEKLGIRIDLFRHTGRSSFQSWLPYFANGQRIISVHNTFISQEDIDNAKDVFFCLCVNANLFIENKLPPVEMLISNNCNIILGTDSYASNTKLNMFEEMKSIQHHFPGVEMETILNWATVNGAQALGITATHGSFEIGKKPGVVVIHNVSMMDRKFHSNSVAKRLI